MFGKRKILKHGESADAVVLNSTTSGYMNSRGIRKCRAAGREGLARLGEERLARGETGE